MTIGTYQKITLLYGQNTKYVENDVERVGEGIAYYIKKTFRKYDNKDNIMLKRTWGPDEGDYIYNVEVYDGELDEENMEITYTLYITVEVSEQWATRYGDLRSWLRAMIKENTYKKLNISYNDEDYYFGV